MRGASLEGEIKWSGIVGRVMTSEAEGRLRFENKPRGIPALTERSAVG